MLGHDPVDLAGGLPVGADHLVARPLGGGGGAVLGQPADALDVDREGEGGPLREAVQGPLGVELGREHDQLHVGAVQVLELVAEDLALLGGEEPADLPDVQAELERGGVHPDAAGHADEPEPGRVGAGHRHGRPGPVDAVALEVGRPGEVDEGVGAVERRRDVGHRAAVAGDQGLRAQVLVVDLEDEAHVLAAPDGRPAVRRGAGGGGGRWRGLLAGVAGRGRGEGAADVVGRGAAAAREREQKAADAKNHHQGADRADHPHGAALHAAQAVPQVVDQGQSEVVRPGGRAVDVLLVLGAAFWQISLSNHVFLRCFCLVSVERCEFGLILSWSDCDLHLITLSKSSFLPYHTHSDKCVLNMYKEDIKLYHISSHLSSLTTKYRV